MNKTCLALPLTYIVFALSAVQSSATEQFSIVNEDFFGQGNTAVQPVLARHSPVSVLTAKPAPEGLEAEMEAVQANLASLFADRRGTSLFRALPRGVAKGAVAKLMQLIASAEAGKANYDAVQHGAKRKPPKKPTQMTVAEINAWIKATPGQPHALGRYQLIPATFRRLVKHQGVKPQARFSPELQDQLAHQLIEEAGYSAFLQAEMPRKTFMLNLAKIWAGLPTSSGKSYYEGYAGNSASLTWSHFDTEMKRIFSS